MRSLKVNSHWWAVVDDLAVWSSPASSSTPPFLELPAMLTCHITSPERSTPGPLAYHMANTPSYVETPKRSSCCVPQMAAAERTHFTPACKPTGSFPKHRLPGPHCGATATTR